MKTATRLVLLACSSLAALALAGTAMAAYQPRLVIKNPTKAVGAATALTLHVEQDRADDPTFRFSLYSPRGYGIAALPPEGATIGSARAQIQANAISPDAIVEVTGSIVSDTYTAAEYPTAVGCVGDPTATIAAVERLQLSAAGQTLVVPMYVIPLTSGPLAAGYSTQLVVCLPPPATAQLGAKLINADLTFTGFFTNPTTAGEYRWTSLWTPYTAANAPNPTGTVEVQSVDRLPAQLTLAAKVSRRNVTLSGTLLEGGRGVPAARVQLLVGRTVAPVRAAGTATTRANGAFSATLRNRARGVWYARARVTVPDRATPCVQTFAPVPCIAANVPGFTNFTSRTARFRIR
jgi:hypothetical protein